MRRSVAAGSIIWNSRNRPNTMVEVIPAQSRWCGWTSAAQERHLLMEPWRWRSRSENWPARLLLSQADDLTLLPDPVGHQAQHRADAAAHIQAAHARLQADIGQHLAGGRLPAHGLVAQAIQFAGHLLHGAAGSRISEAVMAVRAMLPGGRSGLAGLLMDPVAPVSRSSRWTGASCFPMSRRQGARFIPRNSQRPVFIPGRAQV